MLRPTRWQRESPLRTRTAGSDKSPRFSAREYAIDNLQKWYLTVPRTGHASRFGKVPYAQAARCFPDRLRRMIDAYHLAIERLTSIDAPILAASCPPTTPTCIAGFGT